MKVALGSIEVTDRERMRIANFLGRQGDLATRPEIKAYLRHAAASNLEELTRAQDKQHADIVNARNQRPGVDEDHRG